MEQKADSARKTVKRDLSEFLQLCEYKRKLLETLKQSMSHVNHKNTLDRNVATFSFAISYWENIQDTNRENDDVLVHKCYSITMQQTSDNEYPCECFDNGHNKNASHISSNYIPQCTHRLNRNGGEKMNSEVPPLLSSKWAHGTVKIPNLPPARAQWRT